MKNEWDILNQEVEVLIEKEQYKTAVIKAKKALELAKQALDPYDPDILGMLLKLAEIYHSLKQLKKAEPILKRAQEIADVTLNSQSIWIDDDGPWSEISQEQLEKAEPILKRLLVITEKVYGPDDVDVAVALERLASNYSEQGNDTKAESLYKRALKIVEKICGPDNPEILLYVDNLGFNYSHQGKYEKAEPLFKRSLALHEKSNALDGLLVSMSLANLAGLYRDMGKDKEAKEADKRAAEIEAKIKAKRS
jgi:tetratricopeptide (TPR) repeat protein